MESQVPGLHSTDYLVKEWGALNCIISRSSSNLQRSRQVEQQSHICTTKFSTEFFGEFCYGKYLNQAKSPGARHTYQLYTMPDSGSDTVGPPRIVVNGLSYRFQDGSPGLENVNLDLPPGSRTLLIGGMLFRFRDRKEKERKKVS